MTTRKLIPARQSLEKLVGPLTFGMFMRVARNTLEISQAEMAKRLKISPSTLCDIEKERQLVSPKLALKVARAAGLSETQAVRACLQDQVRRAGLTHQVQLIGA